VPWFLDSLVSSVAHRSGKEISALDNTFALIDEYICADLSSRPNFPLQSCGGPYIPVTYSPDHADKAHCSFDIGSVAPFSASQSAAENSARTSGTRNAGSSTPRVPGKRTKRKQQRNISKQAKR